MKKKKLFYASVFLLCLSFVFLPKLCRAMPPGTLLYRTTSDGKMFGYSGDPLFESSLGVMTGINPGHVAIYIGQEQGSHYVVEALSGGIVKTKLEHFVNEDKGEVFVGAKIPKGLNKVQQAKVVSLAKNLASSNLSYDIDFKEQKGPNSGEWTCVGLAEKLYENANIANPANLSLLEYDSSFYGIDITPDGYDDYSFYNREGDCFSSDKEFSMISPKTDLILPFPEKSGFNAGKIYNYDRYIFFPYTQYLQDSLQDVLVDEKISSSFSSKEIRGKANSVGIVLRWSLINNPVSAIKMAVGNVIDTGTKAINGFKTVVANAQAKIFPDKDSSLVILEEGKSIASKDSNNNKSKDLKYSVGSLVKVAAEGSVRENTKRESNSGEEREGSLKNNNNKESARSKIQGQSSLEVQVNNGKYETKTKEESVNKIKEEKFKEDLKEKKEKREEEEIDMSKEEASKFIVVSKPETKDVSLNDLKKRAEERDKTKDESSLRESDVVKKTSSISEAKSASNDLSDTETKTVQSAKVASDPIIISKIYATGPNDFIELYNPNDFAVDLLASGYRLEKSKTAVNPAILIRIGDEADGYYPGGTSISARGYYLIVKEGASPFYSSRANAIATRKDFRVNSLNQSIFLGTASISSYDDEDIVDVVGYGPDAKYYLGSSPADKIPNYHFLNRVDNKGNNNTDFNYLLSAEPEAISSWLEENSPQADDGDDNDDSNNSDDSDDVSGEDSSIEEAVDVSGSDDGDDDSDDGDDSGGSDNSDNTNTEDSDNNTDNNTDNGDTTNTTDDTTTDDSDNADNSDNTDDSSGDSPGMDGEDWDDEEGWVDAEEGSDDASEEEEEALALSLALEKLLIDKIGVSKGDDYIELFNYSDIDIDLAANNIRLEKSKTIKDPAILMRIGDELDGWYPGGTIIPAQSSYLIVRDGADKRLTDEAQAIATRSNFTLFSSGYSIYLGSGPISSNDDEDILDLLGYGADSLYYLGDAPAPRILPGYFLRRNSLGKNNATDFSLQRDEFYELDDLIDDDPGMYVFPETQDSKNALYSWNFDDCYESFGGSSCIGKWYCGRHFGSSVGDFDVELDSPLDANNFSVGFQYKKSYTYPKTKFSFFNESGSLISLDIQPGLVEVKGLPIGYRFYIETDFEEDKWNYLALVVNQTAGYWALYSNGEELLRKDFLAILPSDMTDFKLTAPSGFVAFDEISIWDRSLSPEEVKEITLTDLPFAPGSIRTLQEPAQLVYHWPFEEYASHEVTDINSGQKMSLDGVSWGGRQLDNYAILVNQSSSMEALLEDDFSHQDLSMSYWYKNAHFPKSGRVAIELLEDGKEKPKMLLELDPYRQKFYFNGYSGYIAEGLDNVILNDDAWHHIALAYDSYRHTLSLYGDGELKASTKLIRFEDGEELINKIRIHSNSEGAAIDDLKIFQGALRAFEVREIFNESKLPKWEKEAPWLYEY